VLPHILPQVQLVSGINTGISKLSYELNLQSRAELFLRRAMARAAIADWRLLVDQDLHWKHLNAKFYTLDYEMEGTALENLGNFSEALADFEQAAKQVTDSMPYELWRDVGNARKDPVWRSYQTAVYQKKIGNIYRKMSRQDEAKDAYDKADELIRDASAASDLSPDSRELLKQFSTAPPEQRCEAESELRSLHANISTQIAVSNQHGAPVRLYWLDSSGQRKFYRTIEQGAVSFQPTYENHPWILTDSDGGCLAILVPDSIGQMRYVVD
jgi:von Hippel-Lindau disease tumor supressor